MKTTALREKLYEYIRVADEKKVKAIYLMLEEDIVEKTEWWKDKPFTDELKQRYNNWKSGQERAFTTDEVKTSIQDMLATSRKK